MFSFISIKSDDLPGMPQGGRGNPCSRRRMPVLALLLLYGFSLLGGCASNVISDGGYSDAAFQNGKIRLTCGFACAASWSMNLAKARDYHERQHWQDLARVVSDTGYASDLGYYYLGRAAEGGGHSAAALEYYQLAAVASNQCNPGTKRCGGLDVQAVVTERMAALEEARAEAARKPRVVRDKQLMAAQTALAELGYYAGRADGLYGPKTRGALLLFQEHQGLPQTGKLDDATIAALESRQAPVQQVGEDAGVEKVEVEQAVVQGAGQVVADPAAGAGPAGGAQSGSLVVSATDLMDAPDIFSNVIRAVPKGRRVTVISREADWYKVAYDGDVGYIYADYIK